jgi:hydrogenase maturation factor
LEVVATLIGGHTEVTAGLPRPIIIGAMPGVVVAARVAAQAGVHALHDPTESGLATALHELADAAGGGLLLDAEAVPIYPEKWALCAHFGLDPLGLLASGALLIAADPAGVLCLQADLAAAGIPAAAWHDGGPAPLRPRRGRPALRLSQPRVCSSPRSGQVQSLQDRPARRPAGTCH